VENHHFLLSRIALKLQLPKKLTAKKKPEKYALKPQKGNVVLGCHLFFRGENVKILEE